MVQYDDNNNALTLGDDDSISVGEYDLEYNSTEDEWQARYSRPIGGEIGKHAQINGATYTEDSQVGETAIKFDGQNDWIDTNWTGPSGSFSISVWFTIEDTNNQKRITGNHNQPGGDYLFEVNGDQWDFQIDTISDDVTISFDGPTVSDTTGGWIHGVITFDESTGEAILYDNGTQVNSVAESNFGEYKPSETIYIGQRRNPQGSEFFNGKMDDIRFYDDVLTPSEVTDLFNGVDVTSGLVARYGFEYPETPQVAIDSTGEAFPKNSIPRSTSGSLVPQGLAESVSAGEALADDGNTYSSVQTAVDNATGWVFVGPGTFNEDVIIDTQGLTLEGSGYDTHIDTSSINNQTIDVRADKVTIRSLSLTAIDSSASAVRIDGSQTLAENIIVRDCDEGFDCTDSADEAIISNCEIRNPNKAGIRLFNSGNRIIMSGNLIVNADTGISVNDLGSQKSDDTIIANNIIRDSNTDGIIIGTPNDCIVIGNRVTNSDRMGIYIKNGTECIVANNRVSGSDNEEIKDAGTGTVLDDNKTG